MVAVIRHIQGWPHSRILDEYRHYAYPKTREADEKFIHNFSVSSISHLLSRSTISLQGLKHKGPDMDVFMKRYRFIFVTVVVLAIFAWTAAVFNGGVKELEFDDRGTM
jgi:hypothetical protein